MITLKPTFETVTYCFVLFFHFCSQRGKICGDTMQRAFLEWAYAKFEVDKLSQVQHFQCPACTPSMLAVAVDGNRKLYRFKSQPGCVRFMYNEMLVSHKLLLYSKFNPHLYISFKTWLVFWWSLFGQWCWGVLLCWLHPWNNWTCKLNLYFFMCNATIKKNYECLPVFPPKI